MNSFTESLFDTLQQFGNNDQSNKTKFKNAIVTLMTKMDPHFTARFMKHCPCFIKKLKNWGKQPNQDDVEKSCHIIALRGKKHSGKSYLAFQLRELVSTHIPVHEVSFADGIKELGIMIFESYLGSKVREHFYGDKKEIPLSKNGKPVRYFMQTLGTDICRRYLGDDVWVNIWRHRIRTLDGLVLTPDLRFQNELMALQEAGADIIHVIRKGLSSSDMHVSETQLDNSKHNELVFINDCSKGEEDTRHRLAKMLIEPLNV